VTTHKDRPDTALLIVDVQVGVVAKAHERDAVVANIAALADRAREAGAPVIWVQHINETLVKGGDAWRIVPELIPAPGEPIVEKAYGDAFEDTDLETLLADRQIGRLVVAGAQTDACIRSTLHGALVRGYGDACRGRPHHRRSQRPWSTAARPSNRAHEYLLEIPDRPQSNGHDCR